jgi:peptide/nickel transport system permease protein
VTSYLVRRFGLMLLTLFGISVIIFVMLRIAPGNIADILFDAAGFVDPAEKAQIMKDLGLDQPLPVQYASWIGGLLHGDLGYSYVTDRPALAEILPRIPITARIAGLAVCFAVLIGVPLGVVSAVKQNTRLDYVLRVLSLSALSMPNFWLGLLVLMGFVTYFGTIPIYSDAPQSFWAALVMYSVPAAVVGIRSQALILRLTRSSMLEVLRQDYIRTARSKGASENVVNYHHALKNAVLPVVTVVGLEIAILMGGLVVTETVFNIPGVARFLVEAIRWRDYPIVQNIIMYIAIIVVLVNFTVDMLYAALDPRIKYSDCAGDRAMSSIDYRAELTRAGANIDTRWAKLRFLARRYPLGAVGAVIMALCVFAAVFAPYITVYDPLSTNAALSLARPSAQHWLGCDFMGRDVYSRIVYGARISLAVGLGSMSLGITCGVLIGLTSGYLGGWVDLAAQRLIDILQSLPLLVMALLMTASLGPSLRNTIIAISIALIPSSARVVRANTLSLREQPFVESAKAIGMSEFRIAFRHVLPNTLAPLIVLATAQLGATILIEATLSFLGLGVPEPHPSWGRMLSESAAEYVRTAPWLVIFPGLAISLVVFGTNLFGDALRDILDPRQRS